MPRLKDKIVREFNFGQVEGLIKEKKYDEAEELLKLNWGIIPDSVKDAISIAIFEAKLQRDVSAIKNVTKKEQEDNARKQFHKLFPKKEVDHESKGESR